MLKQTSMNLMIEEKPRAQANQQARVIHFDGGTPCNIPSLGYGNGYGSYRIDDGPVVRVDHNRPMSNNAAEIYTLISALKQIPPGEPLLIIGDSQIALKWVQVATGQRKATKIQNTSPQFQEAVADLTLVLRDFRSVRVMWKGRDHSVSVFGH